MHCKHCMRDGGKGEVCYYCGEPFGNKKIKENHQSNYGYVADELNFILGLLCFSIPLLGIFLFVFWINEYPNRARSAGILGLISIIIGAIILRFFK